MSAEHKKHRKKKSQKQLMIAWGLRCASALLVLLVVILIVLAGRGMIRRLSDRKQQPQGWPSYVREDYLTVNSNSRPGLLMGSVKNIVLHTTIDSEATLNSRRDYYENLKDTQDVQESVHIIADLNGKMLLCVPIDEICYSSDSKNTESISIEVLVTEENPFPTEQAYENLTDLIAWLCVQNNIPLNGIQRHYDVNGRNCPSYLVENEEEWKSFNVKVRTKYMDYKKQNMSKNS